MPLLGRPIKPQALNRTDDHSVSPVLYMNAVRSALDGRGYVSLMSGGSGEASFERTMSDKDLTIASYRT